MSAFGAPKSPTSTTFSGPQNSSQQQDFKEKITNSASPQHVAAPARDSPPPRTRERSSSNRPMSMVQTYQPPVMEIAQDTIPELQPIFSFLNSHSNKLYQEGYFLKLTDLDSSVYTSPFPNTLVLTPCAGGRPNHDRSWVECFAQLVGTILSLWDASALDAAGQDGEVAPTFINLADASIKMVRPLLKSRSLFLWLTIARRLKPFPPDLKKFSLYRTCLAFQRREKTGTCSISILYTLLRNGLLPSG